MTFREDSHSQVNSCTTRTHSLYKPSPPLPSLPLDRSSPSMGEPNLLPMQLPVLLLLLLLSLLIHYVASSPAAPADAKPGDCLPMYCGDIKVSYPFWISDLQPSFCGFPEFELTFGQPGEPGHPLLLLGDHFHVRHIFYENYTLWVNDSNLARAASCPVPNANISFLYSGFSISSANRELFFFRNCSFPDHHDPPVTFSRKVFCGEETTFAHLGHDYWTGERPEVLSDDCHSPSLMVPVKNPLLDPTTTDDYVALVREGFLLEWTVANCDDCRDSRGDCGYSSDTKSFMCICPDRNHSRSCNTSHWMKIIIGVGSGGVALVAAISSFCLFLYLRRKRQHRSISTNFLIRSGSYELSLRKDPELGSSNYRTHVFSYDELHAATNGFDASQELGDGGFGTVYKGQLRDGRVVAVKRLYESNFRRVEQFMNEVDILSRLRHERLVTLYGCTSRHSRELLLVYEFVSNGTVADHLHGSLASQGGLTWPVRLNIAIETAEALAYLHGVEPQIIHRDVKTNNILLDESFHVKVADFGMSRLFPADATHVSTLPQGTPGYVDPEYHQCYQLTEKSDVYSFGVALVELISSKPAVDIARSRHEINLANMAIAKIQNGEVEQLVDPGLGCSDDSGTGRMITMVAELAFRCLQGESDLRPSIQEVLHELRTEEMRALVPDQMFADAPLEESRLLKSLYSPDSVTVRWDSSLTTPNTSG